MNLGVKKSESINKQFGVSVNKNLEHKKSITLIQEDREKGKQSVPLPTTNSIQNKKTILTTANSINKQPIILANTFSSKHEVKTFNNKPKTLNGIMGSDF
jgi:hypothetical protein